MVVGKVNMKVLVTGISGLLGYSFTSYKDVLFGVCRDCNRIANIRIKHTDIRKRSDVMKLLSLNFDTIIHAAAYTNVDECEQKREIAWDINVNGTQNIIDIAEKKTAKIVFISTDYVFDGKKGMYKETDYPNPINFYGKTKLEGEKIVAKYDNSIIVRISTLYGSNPKRMDFVKWVINNLEKGNEIRVIDSWKSNPTFADRAAEIIMKLLKRNASGIFHVCGGNALTKFEFAKLIAKLFCLNEKKIKMVKNIDLPAKRPINSSMSTRKIQDFLGIEITSVKDDLNKFKLSIQK